MKVPYNGEVPGGLSNGKALRVRGVVNDDALGFAINFNCDKDGNTIGIHFNPRPYPEDFVLNSCINGWGKEERNYSWFPFKRGQFFDCFFVTGQDTLNIYVNEKYFTSFAFRVPKEDMKFLNIRGDITIVDVELKNPLIETGGHKIMFQSENILGIYASGDAYIYEMKLVRKVDMPFLDKVPGPLGPGSCKCLTGTPHKDACKFDINLQMGNNPVFVNNDVPLHFSPSLEEKLTVRKTQSEGEWKYQERDQPNFPFKQKERFEINILVLADLYRIFVNGQKYVDYSHRIQPSYVRHISLYGYNKAAPSRSPPPPFDL